VLITADLDRHPPGSPRNDALQAFCRANGIDPSEVSANAPLDVDEAASTLTVTAFVLDDQGRKQIVEGRPADGYIKERRTVPLRSHPSEHSLS